MRAATNDLSFRKHFSITVISLLFSLLTGATCLAIVHQTIEFYPLISYIFIVFSICLPISFLLYVVINFYTRRKSLNNKIPVSILLFGLIITFFINWSMYKFILVGSEWKIMQIGYWTFIFCYFISLLGLQPGVKYLQHHFRMRLVLLSGSLLTLTVLIGWFNTSKESKDWHTQLPSCPCLNPDLKEIAVNDGWARDIGDLDVYHKGATVCFRSYPATKTSAGYSAQQCCYDSLGKLITKGSGAGTPDKISSCLNEDFTGTMIISYIGLIGHLIRDVVPFKQSGDENSAWKKYNTMWVPNKGKGCLSH